MQYTISIADARLAAGLAKQLAAYNAGQAAGQTLTPEQFIVAMLPLKAWADQYAPAVIPSGDWLQRWTSAEKAATRAATDPQIKAWLADLDARAMVTLTDAEVVQGVPYVCAYLEAQGVIAAGQGTVRAAQILAF